MRVSFAFAALAVAGLLAACGAPAPNGSNAAAASSSGGTAPGAGSPSSGGGVPSSERSASGQGAASWTIGQIDMVTPTVGWALGSTNTASVLARTADGGATWTEVEPKPPGGGFGLAAEVIDADHAVVAAVGRAGGAVTYTTADGGASWTEGGTVGYEDGYMSLAFPSASRGYYVAGAAGMARPLMGALYTTTDGGRTWTQTKNRVYGNGCLVFTAPRVGWASTSHPGSLSGGGAPSAIEATTDGGQSWRTETLAPPAGSGAKVAGVGCPTVVGGGAVLPVLLDQGRMVLYHLGQGQAWMPTAILVLSSKASTGITDVVDSTLAWYWDGVKLYATTDGGGHWSAVTPTVSLGQVEQLDFVSATAGWAVSSGPKGSRLLRTTDAGHSWTTVSTGLASG